MSIFGTMMNKIFGGSSAHAAPGQHASAAPAQQTAAPVSQSTPAAQTAAAGASSPASNVTSVDVTVMLDDLNTHQTEKLNWRVSIVDLMKLLNMDSSLSARKELAKELHYTGDMNDSAAMNIWLHKQVMQKIAQNGGKLPHDLIH